MRRWKCIESVNKNLWTVGKTYETSDNGKGLISDNGDKGFFEPWNFYSGTVFEEVKDFTLADLKPCMVVECRRLGLAMVVEIEGRLALMYENGEWDSLKIFDDDLSYNGNVKNKDIIKVYGFSDIASLRAIFHINRRQLLWERIEKSPQQLKLEELEMRQREIADEMAKLRKEME